ncbi:hypothetical protein AAF712_002405 [Marasmius tenuissimus]|uniref:Uncharacterized protein n=1 Tax=Marasmius tenuissimus TaxID=585030 RepID=A0ABR3A9C6_9AGAR
MSRSPHDEDRSTNSAEGEEENPHWMLSDACQLSNEESTFEAAKMVTDVVVEYLHADGNSSPASHGRSPDGTAETTTPENLEMEEVMGPDLGPEETGTRPMYTGRRGPWVGANVMVIGTHHKGCTGILRDVHIDWSLLDTVIDFSPGVDLYGVKSGLMLDVELDIVRAGQAAPVERIDYRDVVELKSLKRLNVWRPLDHRHEVWYLRPDLPNPLVRLSTLDKLPVDLPHSPRPRTPTPPPRSPRFSRNQSDPWNPLAVLPPTEHDHWILHPELVGLKIEVQITGGPHDSKGNSVYVTPVSKTRGVVVQYTSGRGLASCTHTISHTFIQKSKDPIKPSTENSLMVVTAGKEHVGKLVRRIRTFYLGARTEEDQWIVGGVISKDADGERLTDERLELHPHHHVVRVKESAKQRAIAKDYMTDARESAATDWARRPEVRSTS